MDLTQPTEKKKYATSALRLFYAIFWAFSLVVALYRDPGRINPNPPMENYMKRITMLAAALLCAAPAVAKEPATLPPELAAASGSVTVVDSAASPIDGGLHLHLSNGHEIHMSKDKKSFVIGPLFKIENGKILNVSVLKQAERNKAALAAIPAEHKIVYEPSAEVRGEIYVFTDVTCPYCVKLHNEIPELSAGGIRVNYITWPRGSFGSESYTKAQQIMCSSDQKAVLELLMKGGGIAETDECPDSPVAVLQALGQKLGVSGTPASFFETGELVGG